MAFKERLVDLRAVIDLPVSEYGFHGNVERWAEALEAEARDLVAFLRDHRSKDSYGIKIERIRESRCEFCEDLEGGAVDDEGIPWCCNAAQEEYCKINDMAMSELEDK